ncbi:hypothetical protein DERF_005474 [Dermatophagoides farinae]|uniref:Uncharacterized protein n=1 Tax=Dermatophagoides farinae TaxID=6954 RepID=A0A922I6Z5_DERFA|nr:hypothetical protein DERF_005474 [Dermatophagoides farinae]
MIYEVEQFGDTRQRSLLSRHPHHNPSPSLPTSAILTQWTSLFVWSLQVFVAFWYMFDLCYSQNSLSQQVMLNNTRATNPPNSSMANKVMGRR